MLIFLPPFQTSTSVQRGIIIVIPMLSVTTLWDRLTAPAPRDTLEMEHHAAVKMIFSIGTDLTFYYKSNVNRQN